MAQAKPFTWYGEDAPAFKGQLADTTAHVIDSFASEGGVEPGTLVMRGTDTAKQVKQIKADTDSAKAIGIAVHVHKEPENPYYPTGYSVPVITFGDVYVEAGADVKAGDTVAIKAAGGIHNYEEACAFIEAGASALGASAGIAIVEGAPTDERR